MTCRSKYLFFSPSGPIPHNMARPLMVRQPYSVAVLSTEQGGYILSFLKKERLGEKGGAFFNGKEGRDDFRKKENKNTIS